MVGLHLVKQAASLACMIRLCMFFNAKLIGKLESPIITDGGAWGFDLEAFDMSRCHFAKLGTAEKPMLVKPNHIQPNLFTLNILAL